MGNVVSYNYTGGRPVRRGDVTTVRVYSNVLSIESRAFQDWTALQSIMLQSSKITLLGNGAFYGCFSLTSIRLPPTITTLGRSAFCKCSSLTSITLPPTITTLDHSTFHGCSSLTSVTLPPTITTLGNSVFYNCSSLTSVTLPPTITTIGNSVFCGCSSLTTVILPPTITTLRHHLFAKCLSLGSIALPATVTTLETSVFRGCSSLPSIELPTNLFAISITAFTGCSKLTTIYAQSSDTTSATTATITTTINFDDINNPHEFKEWLDAAGFTCVNLEPLLYNRSDATTTNTTIDKSSSTNVEDMYYDMSTWGRTRGADNRLPICTAAAGSLKWFDMRQIFAVNMPAVYEVDVVTGLPLFMLAAVGQNSSIESVYHLLRENPPAIILR
mmetsp:Transcript_11429/g.13498  ORF Transcript_11429/g.13498 Transcript_11429/m.13498 type:complete len:387 (-) Transcript_11429:170-1330(-)